MTLPIFSVGSQTYLYDDFLGAALEGAVAGAVENSGTAAVAVAQRGGVAGLTTGTSSGNRVAISTGLNYRLADGSVVFQTRVKNLTSTATRALFVGFTDTVSLEMPIEVSGTTITSNASDAAGFYFDTDATTDAWRLGGVANDIDKGTINDVVVVNNENAVPTADVYETFRIELTPDGDAVFSYGKDDGTEVLQGVREVGRIADAVRNSVNLSPVVVLETRAASAATAYVDYVMVQGGREGLV